MTKIPPWSLPAFLLWLPSMMDGLQPIRRNKPFPPQAAFLVVFVTVAESNTPPPFPALDKAHLLLEFDSVVTLHQHLSTVSLGRCVHPNHTQSQARGHGLRTDGSVSLPGNILLCPPRGLSCFLLRCPEAHPAKSFRGGMIFKGFSVTVRFCLSALKIRLHPSQEFSVSSTTVLLLR